MSIRPPIIWKGSPNYGYPAGAPGRGGETVMAIVDHIAEGFAAGLDAEFLNRATEKSAHFAVMRDGTIHQYVREEDTAWGAGILNAPDETLPWLPPVGALPSRGAVVNRRVISIEHEGFSGQPFTPEQTAATIALHAYLVARWHIPVDGDHIVGHYRLDSVDRKDCPGAAFPWAAVFSVLGTPERGAMRLTPQEERDILANLDVLWGNINLLEPVVKREIIAEMRSAVVNIKRAAGLER